MRADVPALTSRSLCGCTMRAPHPWTPAPHFRGCPRRLEVVVPTVEALRLDPRLLSIRLHFGPLGLATAVLAVHVHEVLRFGCCQQVLGLARRRAQPGGACPRGARVGLNATRLRCGDFHTNRDFSRQGTREILLNPAFSVQNSLLRSSGSLLLYFA